MFKVSKHIFQAKIPVVKLEATKEYKFKKVDITLMDEKHNGIQCADMILEYQRKYPLLKAIFVVLKEMLFLAQLNDPSQVTHMI